MQQERCFNLFSSVAISLFLYKSVHKINFMVVFVFLAKDQKVTKDNNYDIYLFEILVWARGPKIA